MPSNLCANHPIAEDTPSTSCWHRWTPTALTICVGLGLTIGLFSLIRHWEHRENQTEFDFASKHLVEGIRRATERIELTHEIMRRITTARPVFPARNFNCCLSRF